MTPAAWHALDTAEVLTRLETRNSGLSPEEAARRLAQHGPNAVSDTPVAPAWVRFLAQFRSAFLIALMAAAAGAALIGYTIDAAIIAFVVVINAVIGFIQEDKAHKALAAIRELLTPKASVIRGGRGVGIDARDLVPGDVVALREGDRVPADLRLLHVDNLSVDEAMLTGESFPVEKRAEAVPRNTIVADRHCMAFAGTIVAAGRGEGVAVATASQTELGRITASIAVTAPPTSPLIQEMARLAERLTLLLLVISAGLLAFAVFARGFDVSEAFLATVAFAVAVIPEGLPAVLAITLAVGAARMAARRAIIRTLPAIETLAAVTVIGSDKTGTLTRNALVVREWVTPEDVVSEPADASKAEAAALLRASVLCTGIERSDIARGFVAKANSVDAAILDGARALGVEPEAVWKGTERLDCLAFTSQAKLMAVIIADGGRAPSIIVKGAPERILALSRRQGPDGARLDAAYWNRRIEALTANGRRVLAVAEAPWPCDGRRLDNDALLAEEVRFSFLGLLSLIDPISPEALEAVRAARAAGIAVKMITGDHPGTAKAIAREMGLADGGCLVTGKDVECADDRELEVLARGSNIFARMAPEHKLRLVKALQAQGEVVAVTGDGVNDAPALRAAHIGIAMGKRGSEAARQASQMVLADDNFATIAAAIEAGRTIFDNLRKAIVFNLPTNLAQGLVIFVALLVGMELPMSPTQILWINLVTAVALSSPLAFEPAEKDLMHRPPAYFSEGIVTRFVLWRVVLVSIVLLAAVLALFELARRSGLPLPVARSMAFNGLVAGEIAYLFSVRRLTGHAFSLAVLAENRYVALGALGVVALQLAVTYLPAAQSILGTAGLDLAQWGVIVATGAAIFLLLEAEKFVIRNWTNGGRPAVSPSA